jgi:5-methylcytosine-specific restriction protein B
MPHITDENRSLYHSYASEFEKRYLLEPAGQKHLEAYRIEREAVRRYWAEIKEAKQRGEDITDSVLEKLLPYSNTKANREKGCHISIAPAITKDIRKWFENAGWQQPDNWPNVADAIYILVYILIENDCWEALAEFEANETVSKGIKAGFITPTLYFLNPKYRIVNSKTTRTINYLFKERVIRRDLTGYKKYVEIIDDTLLDLDIPLLQDKEVFDSFCHWMCHKRLGGYARVEGCGQ